MEKGIKKSLWKSQTGDKIFAIALMIPAIITTVSFILVPVVDSIYRSFFDYKVRNIISGQPGYGITSPIIQSCFPTES